MADGVSVQFSASIGALVSGVEQAKSAIDSIRELTDRVADGARSVLEAFGIAFSVDKIAEFVNRMGELGDRTESMASILGVSTEEIGRLDATAKGAGVSTEGLVRGVETFQTNLQKAINPTSQQALALHALGLSTKDFIGLPIDAQLAKFSDAISRFADGGNKMAAVRALFGRMGDELIPFFDKGASGLQRFAEMGERASTVLSGPTTAALEETHLKLVELGMSVEGAGLKIFQVLEPAFDQIVTKATQLIESFKVEDFRSAVEAIGQACIGIAEGVSTFFVEAGGSIDLFKLKLDDLKPSIDVTLTGAAAAAYRFVEHMNEPMSDIITKIREEWNKPLVFGGSDGAVASSVDDMKKRLEDLHHAADKARTALKDLLTPAQPTFDSVAGSGTSNQPPAKPTVPSFGTNALGASELQSRYQGMIKQIDDFYSLEKQQLIEAVAQHKITFDQETAALLQALDARKAGNDAAYDAEIAAAKAAGKDYEAVVKQKIAADDQWRSEHDKIVQDAIQKDQKEWQSALQPLTSAFDSQLRGLLAGTETWGQAMKNIFADLAMDVIKKLEEIAVEKAAAGLTSAFGGGPMSLLGGLGHLFSGSSGSGGGSSSSDPLNISTVANTTATLANTAAISTQTAASAASGAGGGIFSLFKSLFSFLPSIPMLDVGSWSIPHDTLAMVHQGEAVLPNINGMADAFRSGQLGGGGFGLSINGPVIGTQAFAQSFTQMLARTLQSYYSRTPSMSW